jgi:predicted DNA-binding protein
MKFQKGRSGNPAGRAKTEAGCGVTIALYVKPQLADRITRLSEITGKSKSRIMSEYIEANIERIEDRLIMEAR